MSKSKNKDGVREGDHKGILRTSMGWRLWVQLGDKRKGLRVKDPNHLLGIVQLNQMRGQYKADLERDLVKKPEKGTFAEKNVEYLQMYAADPRLPARAGLMTHWVKEFGTRDYRTIVAGEIRLVAARWLTVGPKRVAAPWPADVPRTTKHTSYWVEVAKPLGPNTVAKRLHVLQNFFTRINGRHAPNPAREVKDPKAPKAKARGLSYDVIERILAAMPDTRYRNKLTGKQADAIRARGLAAKGRRRYNASAVAREYGVSSTMVNKIVRGASHYDKPGLTKLRLRCIGYIGLSHCELMGIETTDIHLDRPEGPSVWIKGRDKGDGTKGVEQPLTGKGAAALRALVAADGLGTFSSGSMWQSFKRGWMKCGLKGIRPYDLRHSFATEVFKQTGSLSAVQLMMRHADQRTSQHYAEGAIASVQAAIVEQLTASGGFSATK